MDNWTAAVAILLAVMVGASIPLLFQLWNTLQSARRVADRLDRITARLEEGNRVDEVVEALDGLTRAARQVGNGVKLASAVGAAVGPAIAAAIQAWRESQSGAGGEESPAAGEPAAARDGVAASSTHQKATTEERP